MDALCFFHKGESPKSLNRVASEDCNEAGHDHPDDDEGSKDVREEAKSIVREYVSIKKQEGDLDGAKAYNGKAFDSDKGLELYLLRGVIVRRIRIEIP